MIIYRPSRNLLEEAMSERKIFNDEFEMKSHISNEWDGYIKVEDIVITDESINDERIGWRDTKHVCTKKLGEEDYIERYGYPQCIGWCAMDFDE